MAPRHTPSFFKILLDPAAPHLPLPPDFVTRHLVNKIPKNPIIRSANGKYSWRLKISKIGESYCFSDGWNNVVRDAELRFGDFLIFRLIDESNFKVLIYSPNGCEKDLPSKIKVEENGGIVDDDNANDDVGVEVVNDDEEEEGDDDDEEEEEEEGDDDEDDEYDDEDVEEYEEQIEYVDDDDDDNDDEDEDGSGDIDGDDGDPFFTSVISRTHNAILRLPIEFARLAGIEGEGTITLKNLDGKEWEASLRSEKSSHRYYVSTRWADFRRSNDLSEGDECVFKFIRSEGTLLLAKVTRKRRPARDPRPSGGTPATEAAKRKRGQPQPQPQPQPDDGVPASEDVKRKKGSQQPRPARKVPATEVVKRKKGPSAGGAREVVKGTRGRPADRRRRTRKAS